MKEERILNIFSNKFINIVSIITTIIIILIINLIINNEKEKNIDFNSQNQEIISEENIHKNEKEKNEINNNINNYIYETNWYIEIPSISLIAPISETTEEEVLNKYIGHFEDTSKQEGNIGLAGHNRGYDVNYFENLKNVKTGEKIIYKYNDFEAEYIIDKIEIIKETDWSYLENTTENKITLITCVENEPQYRRCVQATQN